MRPYSSAAQEPTLGRQAGDRDWASKAYEEVAVVSGVGARVQGTRIK